MPQKPSSLELERLSFGNGRSETWARERSNNPFNPRADS
jgi:hypothetical protein